MRIVREILAGAHLDLSRPGGLFSLPHTGRSCDEGALAAQDGSAPIIRANSNAATYLAAAAGNVCAIADAY